MFSYRGATANPANVLSYGFAATGQGNLAVTGPVTPAADQATLADLFVASCRTENQEGHNELATTFTAPAGPPTLTKETPLSSVTSYLVADAAIPTAGSKYGGYYTQTCLGLNFGYQFIIPEL